MRVVIGGMTLLLMAIMIVVVALFAATGAIFGEGKPWTGQ